MSIYVVPIYTVTSTDIFYDVCFIERGIPTPCSIHVYICARNRANIWNPGHIVSCNMFFFVYRCYICFVHISYNILLFLI